MRLIDADALFDFLTDQLEKEVGFYSKGRNAGLNIARSALHDETITPTISPPPNDLLTLEELREMDGEPVWIRNHRTGDYICRVILLSDENFIHFTDAGFCENWSYGSHWTAYRRKPEEETA